MTINFAPIAHNIRLLSWLCVFASAGLLVWTFASLPTQPGHKELGFLALTASLLFGAPTSLMDSARWKIGFTGASALLLVVSIVLSIV